jgi:hypothetical protein
MMGVRRRAKRRRVRERDAESGQDRETLNMEDILSDFSLDELREFLEADLVDVKVDPEFKERLRKQLWDLVQDHARGSRGGTH